MSVNCDSLQEKKISAVENQLKTCGFKRDVDVLVLYLAGHGNQAIKDTEEQLLKITEQLTDILCGLRSIPSLARFRKLRYLWINNNKIQDLTFLIKSYCLTELYLNNNDLTDISGALKHLSALQILLLHNNQLKKLAKTVKELKGMISLQTLNLFHNPLAQDLDYRLYVIHFLPSVQLLDRKPVTQRERESALHLYNHKRSRVVQSIAFGKRVNTPLGTAAGSIRYTQPSRRLMMPSGYEFGDHRNKVPFENPEDAILLRAMTRSLMEFSCIDWNKVPTCQERRLENKAEEPHEKLTVQFR